MKSNSKVPQVVGVSSYTTNWVGTLQLFEKLIDLKVGDVEHYQVAHDIIIEWMKEFPLEINKWGPFFEDIPGWSDTQINAVTFARYIMLHQDRFPNWKERVLNIFKWVYKNLGNNSWEKYGVRVVNEQTVYQMSGNSHTARQAATELLYSSLTGDESFVENAIRQLHWATYMVDDDGKNCYPHDDVWLTDGYGDYVRHFLRAMAAMPSLAPSNANHILYSTSVIAQADYYPDFNKTLVPDVPYDEIEKTVIFYITNKNGSSETLRMKKKPSAVIEVGIKTLEFREDLKIDGWTWRQIDNGGILKIKHPSGNRIRIVKYVGQLQ